MTIPSIFSPMATGNGAFIIHKQLSKTIPNYIIQGYNPYLTLVPVLIPFLCRTTKQPDIIHTTQDYGFFFAKHCHSLVITLHNYVLDPFMAAFSTSLQNIHYKTDLRYFTRESFKSAAIVTAVSHFTANLAKTDLQYSGEIQVIHNGIDTNRFSPATETKRKRAKTIKVLFSGNLIQRKGANLLPMIADKLSNNIEIIYTSGLRTQQTLPSHPRMKNIGNIRYDDMPKFYREADILLFPTVREGLSLAALEAMASGLPVVATNCSSLPELIIDNKGGILCDLESINQFSNAINTLAESPVLRKEMGQFNRERVERLFTLNRMVREYKDLFERIGEQ